MTEPSESGGERNSLAARLAKSAAEESSSKPSSEPNSRPQWRGSLRIGAGLDPAELVPFQYAAPAAAFPPTHSAPSGRLPRTRKNQAPYPEALVKLFPVEGVTLVPMVPAIAGGSRLITYLLVAVIVALIIALRAAATRPKQGGAPDWTAVSISVVSFLLYATALQIFGLTRQSEEAHVLLMSFITIVWIAVVPLFPQRQPPRATGQSSAT